VRTISFSKDSLKNFLEVQLLNHVTQVTRKFTEILSDLLVFPEICGVVPTMMGASFYALSLFWAIW
jgi:hypothetical protein